MKHNVYLNSASVMALHKCRVSPATSQFAYTIIKHKKNEPRHAKMGLTYISNGKGLMHSHASNLPVYIYNIQAQKIRGTICMQKWG